MLTATMGAQCMSWATSPAATELEQVVMDWLRQMIDLPAGWVGVIQDTASTATLVALLTARERATAARRRHGLASAGPTLTVYASREAHSSVDKAVKLAGFGLEQLRSIETDDAFALRPEALAARSRRIARPGSGRPAWWPRSARRRRRRSIRWCRSPNLPAVRRLAPCGRGLCRLGGDRAGAPSDVRGHGAGRQLRLQSRTSGC